MTPCCYFSYYNYFSIWPYYIVIYLECHLILWWTYGINDTHIVIEVCLTWMFCFTDIYLVDSAVFFMVFNSSMFHIHFWAYTKYHILYLCLQHLRWYFIDINYFGLTYHVQYYNGQRRIMYPFFIILHPLVAPLLIAQFSIISPDCIMVRVYIYAEYTMTVCQNTHWPPCTHHMTHYLLVTIWFLYTHWPPLAIWFQQTHWPPLAIWF